MNLFRNKFLLFIDKVMILSRAIKIIFIADKILFSLLIVSILMSSLLPVLAIQVTSLIINDLVFNPQNLDRVIDHLMSWVVILFAHNLSSPLITFLQSNLADKTVFIINSSIMRQSNSLQGLEHFENQEFHNDLQIISSQSYNRPINLVVTLFGLLKDFCLIFYCLVLLYLKISFFGFLVFVCILLQTNIISKMQLKVWVESLGRSSRSRMMNYISSLSTNPYYAKEIRLFPIGEFLYKKYVMLFNEVYNSMFKLRVKVLLWPILPSMILLVGNFLTLHKTVMLISCGALQVGIIAMIIQLFMQLHQTVLSFGEQAGWMSGHLLFFEKYFSFLSKRDDRSFKKDKNSLVIKDQKILSIRFENVFFSYPDGRQALSDINFEIKNSEKLAIVGANGSGKTTIVKLLCGFYTPTSGRIFINDLPLENYDILNFRKLISPVFQDFGNYALSVEENITMGSESVNEEKIKELLSELGADFIFSLPEQLKQNLCKTFGGTDLSVGQWQKIAILRAIYKNASIFILDEPTASLDPISENEIFEQLATICQDKTTILVTHRLTSIKIATRILLLDNGRQLAFDHHKNLIKINKLYKKMFNSQASKYLELLSSKTEI